MLQDEIRREEEQNKRQERYKWNSKIAGQHGATRACVIMAGHMVIHYEPLRLSFLLISVYDLLPSPTNLHRWKLTEDLNYQVCGEKRIL